jgi:hypothetical protein
MANKQVQEYDKLTKEIEETVEKQNKMYYELKNIDEEDVQSANIDSTITDLQERRNNIMNFLEGKYNNNTELRKSLFDNLYENKKELTVQEHEMNELEKKIRDQNEEKTTFHKKVNNQKYKTNKYNYYNQYLAILVVIQIFIIILLNLSRYLGKTYIMYSVSLIAFLTLCYTLYVVYYNNYNRDKHDWNRFYFEAPKLDSSKCLTGESKEDKEMEELEKLAAQKIRDFVHPKCDMSKQANNDTEEED